MFETVNATIRRPTMVSAPSCTVGRQPSRWNKVRFVPTHNSSVLPHRRLFSVWSTFGILFYSVYNVFSLAEYQTLLFYISTFTSAQDTVTRRTFSNNRSYIGDNCSFFASLALERCLASNNINNMYNRCLIDQLYLISKPNSIYLHLVLNMQKTKHRSRCAEKNYYNTMLSHPLALSRTKCGLSVE